MNPVTSMLPIAGGVATNAISRLTSGISFARILHGEANPDPSVEIRNATDAPPPDRETGVHYQAMLQNIHRMRDELHEKIILALQQRGITTDESLAITADADGRLLESSGSWDRADIEQMLEEEEALAFELRELFRHVQSLRQMGLSSQGLPDDMEPTPVRLWLDSERAAVQILS
jgi:hypothetical protein